MTLYLFYAEAVPRSKKDFHILYWRFHSRFENFDIHSAINRVYGRNTLERRHAYAGIYNLQLIAYVVLE